MLNVKTSWFKKSKKINSENKSSTVLDLAQFFNILVKTFICLTKHCVFVEEMPLWLNTFQYNQTNVWKYLTEGMWGRGEYCLLFIFFEV